MPERMNRLFAALSILTSLAILALLVAILILSAQMGSLTHDCQEEIRWHEIRIEILEEELNLGP